MGEKEGNADANANAGRVSGPGWLKTRRCGDRTGRFLAGNAFKINDVSAVAEK